MALTPYALREYLEGSGSPTRCSRRTSAAPILDARDRRALEESIEPWSAPRQESKWSTTAQVLSPPQAKNRPRRQEAQQPFYSLALRACSLANAVRLVDSNRTGSQQVLRALVGYLNQRTLPRWVVLMPYHRRQGFAQTESRPICAQKSSKTTRQTQEYTRPVHRDKSIQTVHETANRQIEGFRELVLPWR